MKFNIDGNNVNVIIIKKNNKNIYFRFNNDLDLIITCNYLVTNSYLNRLLIKNKDSLVKMYRSKLKEFNEEGNFYYLGNEYYIEFDDKIKSIVFLGNKITTKDLKMLDKYIVKESFRVFSQRLEAIKPLFKNLPEFSLKVRKMKTRWGVCNYHSMTVTLNTELLKKEISLIDYVIIHELCHFYHPNHSRNFWLEVFQKYPNYKEARKKLKG